MWAQAGPARGSRACLGHSSGPWAGTAWPGLRQPARQRPGHPLPLLPSRPTVLAAQLAGLPLPAHRPRLIYEPHPHAAAAAAPPAQLHAATLGRSHPRTLTPRLHLLRLPISPSPSAPRPHLPVSSTRHGWRWAAPICLPGGHGASSIPTPGALTAHMAAPSFTSNSGPFPPPPPPPAAEVAPSPPTAAVAAATSLTGGCGTFPTDGESDGFLCDADGMGIEGAVPAVRDAEALHAGQIYFVLPDAAAPPRPAARGGHCACRQGLRRALLTSRLARSAPPTLSPFPC
ncbi:proline-rich receptor-like protein kinase PERK2 [Miscanthus floridulus]|uniref:proline-rich receptor-like protein kinase PERK2 n=1 Tax=Miscanthus floridulus TaxID=154761 RepID=UPI00345849EC